MNRTRTLIISIIALLLLATLAVAVMATPALSASRAKKHIQDNIIDTQPVSVVPLVEISVTQENTPEQEIPTTPTVLLDSDVNPAPFTPKGMEEPEPYDPPVMAPPLTGICYDNEVVLALANGPLGTLRIYNMVDGSWNLRTIADIPARIESLEVDDVTMDGRNDIVIGVWPHVGNIGSVRTYTYDNHTDAWTERIVIPGIDYNVEALATGDANNDGVTDIVIGLEGGNWDLNSRVRLYTYDDGAWIEDMSIAPGYGRDVQAVTITDIDGDGLQEIIVLYANQFANFRNMQIVRYDFIAESWHETRIAHNISGFTRAERMLIEDIDNDGFKEIVVGVYHHTNFNNGSVFILHQNEYGVWTQELLSANVSIVDALAYGNVGSEENKLIVGDRNKVHSFSNDDGVWTRTLLDHRPQAMYVWDAEIGDADNDGVNELYTAADRDLIKITFDDEHRSINADVTQSLPRVIDSIKIADVDHRQVTCT